MKTIAVVALVAFVFLAFVAGGFFSPKTVFIYNNTGSVAFVPLAENKTIRSATIIVPAVDDNGTGVATFFVVQLVPGTGNALVNIDKMVFWTDTQDSIRAARDAAGHYLGIDTGNYDITYTIKANASVIEGPSAGAALTIATIGALTGKQPNASVMITGTINPDGSIGPIGEALAKAKAAKDIGAELFVVPPGQSVEVKYQPEQVCSKFGASSVCKIQNVEHRTEISPAAGIAVVEAKNIGDAAKYFFGDDE